MRILNAFRGFWTKPVRSEPLAAFRIVAAVAIAISVVFGIAPELALLFSDEGLIPGSVADRVLSESGRFSLKRGPSGAWGSVLDGALGSWCLLSALIASLGLLALGKWTRASAIAAYVLLLAFTQRSLTLTNGGDDLAVHALFYLVLAPAGALWALDAPDRPRGEVPAWSLRLIQLQLCAVYLATGLSKLDAQGVPSDWLTGEALYYALNDVTLTRFSYSVLPLPLWICRLLSWATLAFEIGFAFLIWIPRIRPWLLLAGVGLHAGIALTMQVGFFSSNILIFYLVFVPAEALARAAEKLRFWSARIRFALRQIPLPPAADPATLASRANVDCDRAAGRMQHPAATSGRGRTGVHSGNRAAEPRALGASEA